MFSVRNTARYYLTSILASIGIICGLFCQVTATDVGVKKTQSVAVSGPEVGVALLENIFNRFSNVPQIAMSQANSFNQFTPAKKSMSPNSVDYALAIRPKDSSKGWVPPSPSLQIIAQRASSDLSSGASFGASPGAPLAQGRLMNQQKAFVDSRAGAGASAGSGAAFDGANLQSRTQLAYGEDEPETWKGNVLARGKSSAAELQQLSKVENNRLGFWEKDKEAFSKPQETLESNTTKAKLQLQSRDERQAKEESDDLSTRRKRDMAEAKNMADSRQINVDGDFLADKMPLSAKRSDIIALLPPNVVSGIPLVSLGASKAQVTSAFAGLGKLSDEKINGWNVLSLCRKESGKKAPALQLFFRHGLLDAIRIFDKSLIAPDFGVSPGDSLARVKQKFGEPAFLVQEPHPGLGQNYIYPINQAGFQLARPNPAGVPVVVSVLIFSVK